MAIFFDQLKTKLQLRIDAAKSSWYGLILAVFLVAQFYVLMEWIFYVTKPSFLDVFSITERVQILYLTGVLLTLAAMISLWMIHLFGRLIGLGRYPKTFILISTFLPAGLLAAILLLMLDNFTYTIFSFGIATSHAVWRGLYGVIFLALFTWLIWQLLGFIVTLQSWLANEKVRKTLWISMSVWLIAGISLILSSDKVINSALAIDPVNISVSHRPHIIWITGDGLSDERLSLYGFERDTTPNLKALADQSLVAENAFSNVAHSTGSIVSMLTGKTALDTRVVYNPDILMGEDAFQHLPGILRSLGYTNVQFGYPYYVDAYVVNMQDGFDTVNGIISTGSAFRVKLRQIIPEEIVDFLLEISNRITERLKHIYFIERMVDPSDVVLSKIDAVDDHVLMENLLERLASLDQPMFLHIHLIGTHGPLFTPDQQSFSLGKDMSHQIMWDVDFYDDAVLEFDANIGQIVSVLEQNNILENTLLVIGSDHAIMGYQGQRVPLLIRFPNAEFKGWLRKNVQNIDIAPTILDYLGVPIPVWMEGFSLLDGDLPDRYLYSVSTSFAEQSDGNWKINLQRVHPPFYQIGSVSMVDCSRFYLLDLVDISFESGVVIEHTAPCTSQGVFDAQRAYGLLLAFLRDYGYDVSSLEALDVQDIYVRK